MAVVKADAYGHGIETVAAAVSGHVDWFGVANLQEAVCVRRATERMPVPVLILGPALPSERAAIVEGGFCPVISTLEEASAYEAEALRQGVERFELHLAVDTGMGRMGVWEEEAVGLIQAIGGMPSVRLAGLATHFPSADDDAAYTQGQIVRFDALVTRMRAEGWSGIVHLANSAGMLRFPECCADLARVGLAIYGCSPVEGGKAEEVGKAEEAPLSTTLTWKTRVVLVRDLGPGRSVSYGRTFVTDHPTRVATLAVGYADGYPRSLSGSGAVVLIEGVRCPLLGRVTMDQIMVDVSDCAGVECGAEAVLLGDQGGQQITVHELARWAGTIPWEIFTGFGGRVVRVAVD
jgi:alanine racemase